jgi:hypothetical protein
MHFKSVATGDLAEIVRKLLDEAKCSTLDYVILWLNILGSALLRIPKKTSTKF